jgi:glycosyltransferase involved in cell wall biosynthesis
MTVVKRLLLCPPLYPPSHGGSQALFADLAELWRRDGGEVVVCTSELGSDHGQVDPAAAGITVWRFSARAFVSRPWQGRILEAAARLGPRPWRTAIGFPHILTRGYRRFLLRDLARQHGPFHLMVGGVLPHTHFLEPAVRFAARHGIPWVAVPLLHAGLLGRKPLRQVAGPAAAALLASAHTVVALTPAEIPGLLSLGIPRRRITILPAALMDEISPRSAGGAKPVTPGRRPYVLQAGALAADKGTDVLLAAHARRVSAGSPEFLVLAGHPQPEVYRLLAALPPAARRQTVLVEGPGGDRWRDIISGATVLVQPSRADSFGRVILEAWREGRPVIVAAAGGLPHLVRSGLDGHIVPAGDVPALAAALEAVFSCPEAATRLGASGRRRFQEQFTWRSVYPRWRQALAAAMTKPAGESAA